MKWPLIVSVGNISPQYNLTAKKKKKKKCAVKEDMWIINVILTNSELEILTG